MPETNPIVRSANNGLVIGAIAAAIIVLQIVSLDSFVASLVELVLVAAMPFVAYRLLARDYAAASPGHRRFAVLWVDGIGSFVFGSLVLGIAMYVMLRFVAPDYISRVAAMGVEAYRSVGIPEATQLADELERMIRHNTLPTPMNATISLIWLMNFTGSFLTFILALIIVIVKRKK